MSDEYTKGYIAFRMGVPYNAHQSQQWRYGWRDADDDELDWALEDDDYGVYDDDELYYYGGGYGDGGF